MNTRSTPLGILLVNLGTPDAPDAAAIRRYLAEFLSDPRVVSLPRAIWLTVLYTYILPFRPARLVPKYQHIWNKSGSPIRALTELFAANVETSLAKLSLNREIHVAAAMTYGSPSIADAVASLRDAGAYDLIAVPLFPQYSSATTAPVFDKLASVLHRLPVLGDLRFVDHYFESVDYIGALAQSLQPHVAALNDGAKLLFSYHGVPVSMVEAGDPYVAQCQATAEAVAGQCGLADDQWLTTFQSRFGRAPWVEPYTDETLRTLAQSGTRQVIVICPGFAADCLETLHEIEVEGREIFIKAGGEQLTYVPALNASDAHVEIITHVIMSRLYPTELPQAEINPA